jgi:hypothetical protein
MVKQIYFHHLNNLVLDLLGNNSQQAHAWWNSPNKAFDNITPFEVYKNDPKLVLDYLMQHLQY